VFGACVDKFSVYIQICEANVVSCCERGYSKTKWKKAMLQVSEHDAIHLYAPSMVHVGILPAIVTRSGVL
jgi:hypothetical protein